MTRAVVDGADAVAAINALAALVGAAAWYWGGPRQAFWLLLRLGQAAAVLFAVAIGVAALAGRHSRDGLFYLYALLPLAIAFLAEQLRVASAETVLAQRDLPDAQAVGRLSEIEQRRVVTAIVARETAVMALAALVVVFLALRAAATASGF
jgi:hypothetical protein